MITWFRRLRLLMPVLGFGCIGCAIGVLLPHFRFDPSISNIGMCVVFLAEAFCAFLFAWSTK